MNELDMLLVKSAVELQLYRLGDESLKVVLDPHCSSKLKIVGENVVISIAYDWRDRYLSANYRSHEAQADFERAQGIERLRLYDSSDSALVLLQLRGNDIDGAVEAKNRAAIEQWMERFFDALKDQAADVLRGEANGLGTRGHPPPQVRTWQ